MWRSYLTPKRWFPAAVFALLCLIAPALGRAECSLTFLPMEESKYLLKGTGCAGIAAVNFTVDYDATDLFTPRVDVMGGRMLEEDGGEATSRPGSLEIHILRDDPGAGYFEACVYFQKREDYPAVINFVTVEVADLSGEWRPVPVKVVPPVPGMNEPDPVEAPSASTVPPSALAKTEHGPPAAMEPDGKAVFERFRDFAGEKSLAAFKALFSRGDPCCRQVPPVVITDGKQTAQVVIGGVEEGRVRQMKNGLPLFSVRGGELISVKRGKGEEEWIAFVQPYEKWWDVRVSCTAADETIHFPLTAAPAIAIPPHQLAGLDESTFLPRLRSFLEETGKEKPPAAVWFREYLFAANYLAALEKMERALPRGTAKTKSERTKTKGQ